MKKDGKPDTLAVIDNYKFCDKHTYTRTWQLYDLPAQRAESVKIPKFGKCSQIPSLDQISFP